MTEQEKIITYFQLNEKERSELFAASGVTAFLKHGSFAAGYSHFAVLREDGTVSASGDNRFGQCGVGDWRDIIKVAAGDFHTVGLKRDGSVAAAGDNKYGQCNVDSWSDVKELFADRALTVGLTSSGEILVSRSDKHDNAETKQDAPATDDTGRITEGAYYEADSEQKAIRSSKEDVIEKISDFNEEEIKDELIKMGKQRMLFVDRLDLWSEEFLNQLYQNLVKKND